MYVVKWIRTNVATSPAFEWRAGLESGGEGTPFRHQSARVLNGRRPAPPLLRAVLVVLAPPRLDDDLR